MPRFIDAWRKDTGQKLPNQIPDTWIRDGVNPNLTDSDPSLPQGQDQASAEPSTPEPAGLDASTTPKEV